MKAYLYDGWFFCKVIYVSRGIAIDCGKNPDELTEIELIPADVDPKRCQYAHKTKNGWKMTDRYSENYDHDSNYAYLHLETVGECRYPKYLPVLQVNGKSSVRFNAYPDRDGSEYEGDVYPLADQNIKSGMVKVLRLTEDGKAAAVQWHCTAPTDDEIFRIFNTRYPGHDINITWCHNDNIGDWVLIGNEYYIPCAYIHGGQDTVRHDELVGLPHTVTEQISCGTFIVQGYGLAEDWGAYFKTWNQVRIPGQLREQVQHSIYVKDPPYQFIFEACGLHFSSLVGIPFLDAYDMEQTIFNVVKKFGNELVEEFRQYFNEVNDNAMQVIRSAVKKGRLSVK